MTGCGADRAEFARAKPDASLQHLIETTAYYFRLPLLAVSVLGAWMAMRWRPRASALFVCCWAFVPLIFLAAVGLSMMKTTARYALCSLPAIMLLAGAASVRLSELTHSVLSRESNWGRWLTAAVIPAILLLDMLAYDYLYFTSQQGDRPQWRQAAKYASEAAIEAA